MSDKEVVLPFNQFPGADTLLGPEMRSTGEDMGIDYDFASSYAKAQIAAGQKLPTGGECARGGRRGGTARTRAVLANAQRNQATRPASPRLAPPSLGPPK